MKKTYSTPNMFCIKLGTVNIMAVSEFTKTGFSSVNTGTDGDEIEVKGVTDKSLWDEEW